MTRGASIFLFTLILAVLQSKTVLWSGNSPDLLLMGLISFSGSLPIINLMLLALFGFFILAGPVISVELIMLLVIVAFAHFLRLFVFGHSPFLTPFLSAIGVCLFYLGTVGVVFFTIPLFLVEIVVMSIVVSFCAYGLLVYL